MFNNVCYIRFHQEQTKRKLELEEQYNRIQNLLDFEINRDTESKYILIFLYYIINNYFNILYS